MLPSITTFSRATGEVGVAAGDEGRLEATRYRRWPVFALGAVAVVGLAVFLLVRPSRDSAPPATTGTPSGATKAAAIAGGRQEPAGNPGQVAPALPSGVDGGVAPPAVAGASVAAKPMQAPPPAVAGAPLGKKPARAAQPRHPPASKSSKSANEWLFLH
jgi:hypothetical protein